MQYLSTLFLKTLSLDFSWPSVEHAVAVCNDELSSREQPISVTELRDFWDVYQEFHEHFSGTTIPLITLAHKTAIETGLCL